MIELGKCVKNNIMIPTGGFGVSPVEDSGGVMGWEDVCKKLAGRKKSDKNEMI